MTDKSNRYIAILSYAANKLENDQHVDLGELVSFLENSNFSLDKSATRQQFESYCAVIFDRSVSYAFDRTKTKGTQRKLVLKTPIDKSYSSLYMTPQAYQDYLELKELKEARESAQQARKYAIWAITVSIIALVASIWTSLAPQEIYIDDSQVNEITEIIKFRP